MSCSQDENQNPVLDEDIVKLLVSLHTQYRDRLREIMQLEDGNAVTGYNGNTAIERAAKGRPRAKLSDPSTGSTTKQ